MPKLCRAIPPAGSGPSASFTQAVARAGLVVLTVLWAGGAFAQNASNAQNAYFDFLTARRLESQGDNDGALTALKRASTLDPRSAEIKAEIASFHLRHNQRPEAEDAAKAALAIDEKNVEANRALGLIYSAVAENTSGRVPAP